MNDLLESMLVVESSVDFPQESLDSLIWKRNDKGEYSLRKNVKDEILGTLMSYGKLNLEDISDRIHITGSIGTNLYQDDTDIDVHLIPDVGKLPKTMTPEEWQRDIKKYFNENITYVGEHPIEVYLQLNPDQELMSDALYNMTADEWTKGPYLVDLDYNPYSVFEDVLDRVRELSQEADLGLGELKRDMVDYETIQQAISRLPKKQKESLKKELEVKLDEVKKDIEDLMKTKKQWVDMRKRASKPETPEQALQDVELVLRWKDANATFKFLNRYGYIKFITELEKMLADKELDDKELDKIGSLMKAL